MFDCAVLSLLMLLRLNDSPSWILRFRPWKFLANSKMLSVNLENVRQASVCQTVPKFWFICLFYSFSKKLIYWNAKGEVKSQTLEPFVIRRSASLFWLFRVSKKFSRLKSQNSTLNISWPQRPQKRHTQTFFSLKSIHFFQRLMGGMNKR